MIKYFLCLANSYKHDNRCLAGAEVKKIGSAFALVKDKWGHPVWFRPINRWADAGAIPNEEAIGISFFDIVKVTGAEECPEGAQVENYFYDYLFVVGSMEPTKDLLNELSKTARKVLFGNRFSSIIHDHYNRMDYSILMITANDVNCYMKDRIDKQPQPRMRFTFNDIRYDFPVTDPDFRHLMENNLDDANSTHDYYLVLSLGVICEDKHYKLVAGVITAESNRHNKNSSMLANIPNTARETFALYQRGLSVDQIAQHRGIGVSTINSHLTPFVARGILDVHSLVSDNDIHNVSSYMRNHPDETRLRPIYEYFGGNISYDSIRFVLASLK